MFNPVLDRLPALRVHLCGDEVVIVTIDPRTGRLSLRDTGDLAAAGRGPRFAVLTERLAENPAVVVDALMALRLNVSLFSFSCSLGRD
jgi:mediator of RNA polymerase II transcription subunit 14